MFRPVALSFCFTLVGAMILGKEYYVFVLDKSDAGAYFLRKVKVEIGKVSDGYTEITSRQDIKKVLVKGVYNLPL